MSTTNDDVLIDMRLIFGHIEIIDLPPRIEGNDLIPRYRYRSIDGNGKVEKDEVCETGARLVNGAPFAWMFRPR